MAFSSSIESMGPLGSVKKLVEKNSVTVAEMTGPNFELVTRHQCIEQSQEIIEAFPDSWFYFFRFEGDAPVSVKTARQYIPLGKRDGFFLPPFALVHWKVPPGPLMWQAFRSIHPLPQAMSQFPLRYPERSDKKMEASENSVQNLIGQLMNRISTAQGIDLALSNSLIARQLKQQIDFHYLESTRLEELCAHLGTSLSNASHAFTKCFGLSPIRYRNKLRIYRAVLLMAYENKGVTETCYASGFDDFSRFYRNFQNQLGVKPSDYQLRNLLQKNIYLNDRVAAKNGFVSNL